MRKRVQQIFAHVNWWAFFAGVSAIGAIYVFAYEYGVNELFSPKPLRLAYIGAATGHYLGRALDKDETKLVSAYLGGFSTLFLGAILVTQFSVVTAGLVLSLFTLLASHHSGLIEERKSIENLLSKISEYTPVGLILIVLAEYLYPALLDTFGAEAVLFAIGLGILFLAIVVAGSYIGTIVHHFVKQTLKGREEKEEPK